MCFYCFLPHFILAGITCTCIFLNSTHEYQTHLSVIGGAFLLESIIWCTWIVRYLEFGGYPLFVSSECIEYIGIAVGISAAVHYTVDIHHWEYPLEEVPLYVSQNPAYVSTRLLVCFFHLCGCS